jgi:hypothetical protein
VTVPPSQTDVFVNPSIGNDANDGTAANPLRTLTQALCKTGPGKIIRASTGTYSTATNGEQFPLVVRGQKVRSSFLRLAIVTGVGPVTGSAIPATFVVDPVAASASEVTGFAIDGDMTSSGIGILVRDGSGSMMSMLLNNRVNFHQVGIRLTGDTTSTALTGDLLTGNVVGVDVQDDATASLTLNVIDEGMTGVRIGGTATVMLRSNQITDSATQNVEVSSVNADLGTAGSSGSNTIQNATGVNIWNRTTATIPARGNTLNAARANDQSNTDELDATQNLANEFFPNGCIDIAAGSCP